ncbi:MAG TPA: cytidylate kinase-like family protein [Ktedonobacteraceae bacterium]|nr:cytidylate kinase-like family protein [Ktedonobacteraceae bacterium]
MSQASTSPVQMRAIALSRQYGSGGGEIAMRLASRLGWLLSDHEIVACVARELGISEAEATERDEYAEGMVSRLLSNMQFYEPAVLVAVPASMVPQICGYDVQLYAEALQRVVMATVEAGQVVIVGRGGQMLLGNRPDVLLVRIIAPFAVRIANVMRHEGIGQAEARSRIQLKDRDLVRYLQSIHGCHPEDPHLYDLVVNTHRLDLDDAVDLICLALEKKARYLVAPPEATGPDAEMMRCSRQLDDIQSPDSIQDEDANNISEP